MNCPSCSSPTSFVPANQNWWCNTCLTSIKGPAPTGQSGLTADQLADERHQASHAEIARISDSIGGGLLGFDTTLISMAGLLVGGLLLATGFTLVGGIIIGLFALLFLGASVLGF
jgi:hypothetical protein